MTRRKGGARRGGAAHDHAGHDHAGHAGRAPSQRQLRVGEELRHALARILGRGDLGDPALDGVPVTVTEVRMSPDLRAATAFVTPFGGGDATEVVKALNRAGGYFRGQIAHEVKLRLTPSVRFTADLSFDQATRVERLLHDPVVARDLEEPEVEDDSGASDGEDPDQEKTGDGA
jgi:ribosome-binding factor A